MGLNNNVLHTIRQQMPQFSKGQKRIAAYILEHYDKAAFMTASRLGQMVEVSESTVESSPLSSAFRCPTTRCRGIC